MLKRMVVAALILLLLVVPAWGKRKHLEKWYQDRWCAEHQGVSEVVLADASRCDCITDMYAIEFDFASKWAEAIGQSLFYATQTGKQAGIVLILESVDDRRYLARLKSTIDHNRLPIKVWVIKNVE